MVIQNLANNAFKYQVILSDKTNCLFTFNFYVFNLSTNSQYNDTKFKSFFVDFDIISLFIETINSLKLLKQLNNFI